MIRKPDLIDLPLTARRRVRLPDTLAPTRLFHGWGPGLER
jgi:hypothetical protein